MKLNSRTIQRQIDAGRIDVASLSVADRARLTHMLSTNGSKYSNKRVKVDGYTFDSKLEAERYKALKLRLKAGEIKSLKVHPVFPLVVEDTLVTKYEADFSYYDIGRMATVIEDTKGFRTDVYKIKRALMKALYGITVREVKR